MKKILMLIAFVGTYAMASSDITISEKQICIDKIAQKDTIILREVRVSREARRENRVLRGERKNRDLAVETKSESHVSRTIHFRENSRLVRHSRHSRCLRIAVRKSRIVRHTVLLASL